MVPVHGFYHSQQIVEFMAGQFSGFQHRFFAHMVSAGSLKPTDGIYLITCAQKYSMWASDRSRAMSSLRRDSLRHAASLSHQTEQVAARRRIPACLQRLGF